MSNPETISKIGAIIRYCGHDAWFVADVMQVGNTLVIRAPTAVTMENVRRPCRPDYDFHIDDFNPCFWRPDLGVFVVTVKSVKRNGRLKR